VSSRLELVALLVRLWFQIKSLQGAGPNPDMEAEFLSLGHSRETIRFFMEVHGDDHDRY
jgi:hypothetical protein